MAKSLPFFAGPLPPSPPHTFSQKSACVHSLARVHAVSLRPRVVSLRSRVGLCVTVWIFLSKMAADSTHMKLRKVRIFTLLKSLQSPSKFKIKKTRPRNITFVALISRGKCPTSGVSSHFSKSRRKLKKTDFFSSALKKVNQFSISFTCDRRTDRRTE